MPLSLPFHGIHGLDDEKPLLGLSVETDPESLGDS